MQQPGEEEREALQVPDIYVVSPASALALFQSVSVQATQEAGRRVVCEPA